MCSSVTPKAGAGARSRSVTARAWKRPSSEKPITVSSRPGSSRSIRQSPEREAASASSTAGPSSSCLRRQRQPALALAIGRLDDERKAELAGRGLGLLAARGDGVAGVRKTRLGEALALLQLRDGELGALHRERMGKTELGGDPRRDRHRPVDPGRNHSVHLLGRGQPLERRLVLRRDQRAPIGERKAGRRRIAIGGDHVQPAPARRLRADPAGRARRRGRADASTRA